MLAARAFFFLINYFVPQKMANVCYQVQIGVLYVLWHLINNIRYVRKLASANIFGNHFLVRDHSLQGKRENPVPFMSKDQKRFGEKLHSQPQITQFDLDP